MRHLVLQYGFCLQLHFVISNFATIASFSSVCTALRAWLFSSASERVVARLRKNLLSHLVHQVKTYSWLISSN